jgi:DNA transformation protein
VTQPPAARSSQAKRFSRVEFRGQSGSGAQRKAAAWSLTQKRRDDACVEMGIASAYMRVLRGIGEPMATSQTTIDFLLDQLASLPGVRTRKMFGEYALYFEEKVVALVCDNQVFVKITPAGQACVGNRYQEGEAYPGAKPSMLLDAEDLEDGERFCELIRTTAASLPALKPKAPKKVKGGKKARASRSR